MRAVCAVRSSAEPRNSAEPAGGQRLLRLLPDLAPNSTNLVESSEPLPFCAQVSLAAGAGGRDPVDPTFAILTACLCRTGLCSPRGGSRAVSCREASQAAGEPSCKLEPCCCCLLLLLQPLTICLADPHDMLSVRPARSNMARTAAPRLRVRPAARPEPAQCHVRAQLSAKDLVGAALSAKPGEIVCVRACVRAYPYSGSGHRPGTKTD